MLTILGLVALLPASQLGMGALLLVTMTSDAGPVGQPGCAVIVVVIPPVVTEDAGLEAADDEAAGFEAGGVAEEGTVWK
jgi:hypothetical protein